MSKKWKPVRTKGKIRLSEYFKKLEKGDHVAIIEELSIANNFPTIIQGRNGPVESNRGRSYIIKMKDNDQEKRYIIEPIHLKKIKTL